MKKASSLTMDIIILSILALLVLLVLMIIFGGKINIFNNQTTGCLERGGLCYSNEGECKAEGGQTNSNKCKEKEKICCVSTCVSLGGFCTDNCPKGKEFMFGNCLAKEKGKTCCGG